MQVMSSTFSGFSIAVTGMAVSQSGLAVVSSNISNINTEGYSRKQLTSAEQNIVQPGNDSVGSGVTVAEIRRARNTFLDQTYRTNNAKLSYWEQKETNITEIQRTLNEFSAEDGSDDNGLEQTLEDFFSSWEELSKSPDSLSNRQALIESAGTMLNTLQDIDEQLQQIQQDGVEKVGEGVAKLNDLTQQVAGLNQEITQKELNGVEAGDLRDQRDSLLDQMSALANITVSQSANGVLEVSIGGVSLVRGSSVRTLTVTGDGTAENPLKVQWANLNCDANITSGSIKSYLEDSDQSGLTDVTSLPVNFGATAASSVTNLRQALNILVTTMATSINELHTSGVDLNSDAGLDFFVPVDTTKELSIQNIQVNPELDDLDKIVTSVEGDAGDNTIADQIVDWVDKKMYRFDDISVDFYGFYGAVVSWLASAGDQAGNCYDTQSGLTQQVDNKRQSISSTSLDEETEKMIVYQNAYNANTRVLSVIDGLIADIIEDLGS